MSVTTVAQRVTSSYWHQGDKEFRLAFDDGYELVLKGEAGTKNSLRLTRLHVKERCSGRIEATGSWHGSHFRIFRPNMEVYDKNRLRGHLRAALDGFKVRDADGAKLIKASLDPVNEALKALGIAELSPEGE